MYVAMNWLPLVARLGNEPGDHRGSVTVRLADGSTHKVASGELTVCAEAGNLIGLAATLSDGRSAFFPAGAVLEVADCAEEEAR